MSSDYSEREFGVALAEVYKFMRKRLQERREGAILAESPSRRVEVPVSETLTTYDTMGFAKYTGQAGVSPLAHP